MKSPSSISAASENTLGIGRNTAAFFYVSGVFVLLAIQIARSYEPTSSISSLILGSGPNFIAALCLPVAIPALINPLLRSLPRLSPQRWAVACFAATQLGLIGWEFLQLSVRGMVFDLADISVTVIGSVVWLALSKVLSRGAQRDA